MLQNVKDLTASGVIKGLNTQYNLLALQKDQSPNMMNVKVNYDGSIEKRLGSTTTNTVTITGGSASTAGFSPTTSSILTSFVSYWPLDEPSGDRLDKYGTNVFQQSGGVLYASGKKNQAALFVSASSQFLQAASSHAFTNNPAFSYSSWFYLNSTGGTVKRTILSKGATSSFSATGGTITQNGNKTIHTFTSGGTFTPANSGNIEILMVAGGGGGGGNGGGNQGGGGGGAGGIVYNSSFAVTAQAYTVAIGTGGAGGATDTRGTAGGNTTFTGVTTATGGGGGGSYDFPTYANAPGGNGGCGGGGGPGVGGIGGTGSQGQNGAGTTGSSGGGGGGNTQTGQAGSATGGNGGNGTAYSISGTSVVYAGGGGGGYNTTGTGAGTGGTGGGGKGAENSTNAVAGTDGLGGGGGGGGFSYLPAKGGDGVVIISYSTPNFEYSLHVGTDNLVTFEVSSSGTAVNGTVKASSFGTVGTGTWYNAICWYDSATAKIGIVVNESFPVISAYTAGIKTGSSLLIMGAENGSHFMDGRIDEVGFWTKKMGSDGIAILYNKGSGNTYGSNVDATPWASFDFGASSIRWLTVAAGSGVYASSNLGLTWVNIATDRSATYQYFDRSKNVEILTSDAYDQPLYWAGSVGTFAAAIGNSSPLCKYSINFQGYLILLNSNTSKRSFNYLDENFQLSSTAWTNFDLPSSADDEITACFILRRYLYISTRYKIYRISFVGGNPVWQYTEVKSWGYVPRTVKKVVISNQQQGQTSAYSIGEVVIGLSYDRKLKIFDGSGDQILSNNIEKDNDMCEFALDKVPYVGSGPILSFAELDPIPNVYRLCVAIGGDSRQTTHFINYDGRSQALYPYSNMNFNCMCVAESANRQYLMAFDRVGYCHMMDSGNLDGGTTPINDYYESPFMFDKTPSQSSKGHKTDLFFSNTTSGNVHYSDRTDFSNNFKERKKFVISGSAQKLVHYESVDVPEMYNTYQFGLSSSSGTNEPWRLQRYDHFTKGLGIGRNE